ncbi:hypothetical protein L1S45_15760 [Aeromonas dhakensis]|uniref:hypothetical protein n=1 Tax=Aeromonas dhakensis TaxID=196024 RepID=UPI00208E0234|nr:hypothetical protein [Aeromonas dhakensis]USP08623.1 hypothetical protein L1S45_15760 [Aeromonas dhakensis]
MNFKFYLREVNKESFLNDFNSPLVQWVSLIIVSIILFSLFYEPYLDYRAQIRENMFSDMKKIERLERIKNSRDTLEHQNKAINEQYNQLLGGLLDSKNYNRGVAEQVGLIEIAYKENSLLFGSRRFQEPTVRPWVGEEISSQWSFSGGSQNVVDFIYNLSSLNKIILPEKITITIKNDQKAEMTASLVSYRQLPPNELRFQSREGNRS